MPQAYVQGMILMRSRALNTAFNRALTDAGYRQAFFNDLRRTLLEAGVPEPEISVLEAFSPRSLEELANALERVHTGTFSRAR